jgi:hypothetical protein
MATVTTKVFMMNTRRRMVVAVNHSDIEKRLDMVLGVENIMMRSWVSSKNDPRGDKDIFELTYSLVSTADVDSLIKRIHMRCERDGFIHVELPGG